MFITELQRHLAVCGVREVEQFTKRDKKFWNVVSILEPSMPRQAWRDAKEIHHACFHDAEESEQGDGIKLPKLADIVEIFRFIDERPGQAMLIHCRAGQSRSAAVALALIVRGLVQSGVTDVAGPAVDNLLEIRRQSCPNALILRQGLSLFLDSERTEALVKQMLNHPQLMDNRFVTRLQKDR